MYKNTKVKGIIPFEMDKNPPTIYGTNPFNTHRLLIDFNDEQRIDDFIEQAMFSKIEKVWNSVHQQIDLDICDNTRQISTATIRK